MRDRLLVRARAHEDTSPPPGRAVGLFVRMWAAAHIIHLVAASGAALHTPASIAVVGLAFAVILRPSDGRLLVAMMLLQLVDYVVEMPGSPDHWALILLVNLAILLTMSVKRSTELGVRLGCLPRGARDRARHLQLRCHQQVQLALPRSRDELRERHSRSRQLRDECSGAGQPSPPADESRDGDVRPATPPAALHAPPLGPGGHGLPLHPERQPGLRRGRLHRSAVRHLRAVPLRRGGRAHPRDHAERGRTGPPSSETFVASRRSLRRWPSSSSVSAASRAPASPRASSTSPPSSTCS